ncbi:SDR family oxidoreductase [Mucilaginibacter achroorhodeus]|uniref:SDR family oxidoreductase n=1 Tax=Mucilaginibacter achroorhodeus TaxID=2599294 RepID=A0A563U5V5_9SPHI|nr:SDR family oxidoreductase [Mucilaginibacter achroorhodeus]TWR26728.1 SDR family oxidoreductase [Mucilaginibacter achroorhodeus]
MWNLHRKKILITGGTRGIGHATVIETLKLGAQVLFTARSKTEVASFEQELQEQGLPATGLAGDMADAQRRQEISNWINAHWGVLDVLVNNAGMNIRKPTLEFTVQEYQKILEVNLIAPFELSRSLHHLLVQAKHPAIVNIASVAGFLDVQTGSPYAMSKAALIQQTKSLAAEWAKDGIRVNALSPWFTETSLTEALLLNEAKLQDVLSRTPLQRVARAEEMAAIIAFLAMDHSSYIAGQNIIADGGMSATALLTPVI